MPCFIKNQNFIHPIILGCIHTKSASKQYYEKFFKKLKEKNKRKIQLFYEIEDNTFHSILPALNKIYGKNYEKIQKDERKKFIEELANKDETITNNYIKKIDCIVYRNSKCWDNNPIVFWSVLFNNKVLTKSLELNKKISKYNIYSA
ncbi:MAG: hypothetical protein GY830_08780 [Bacteroidetes bacterium]|nr:hypothetical protein [Bacteroidota bacterium]